MMRFPWLIFVMLLTPFCANANDTAASVGVGGLVLEKNNDIEMVSEVLEISTVRVRVTYHFLNISDKDIKTTVAFPMPAYGYADFRENMRPLESFRMSVNGKQVSVKKDRAFLIDHVDVTAKLRKMGFSDAQIFVPENECLMDLDAHADSDIIKSCSLTKKQVSDIHNLGGKLWEIQETAYWDQVFPAHKEIEVIHEYKPKAGFNENGVDPEGNGCIDAGTTKLLRRRFAEAEAGYGGSYAGLREVKYILGTGRNWRGPIKYFKLIIDKDTPEAVVTLCFPGKAVKTSPTTIEFTRTNYVPQDRLDIFFYGF